MNVLFQRLRTETNRIADLRFASAVLSWDQETYMPPKGQKFRAQQLSTLHELAHNNFTSKEFGDLLHKLSDDVSLNDTERKNVQLLLKDFNKAKKLPTEYVVRLSAATSNAFHSWVKARKENNFTLFEKELANMVELQKEKAAIYGYEAHPYNALMDDYEPGATVAEIDTLFTNVKAKLKPLIDQIAQAKHEDDSFMYALYPKDKQWDFGMFLLKELNYDLEAGRQDLSEHPFSTSFNSLDVRVTTRVHENNLHDMIWSCVHECGHALYEQGLPAEQYGLPCGESVSLGIHESQSRFHENNLARSLAFWQKYYGELQNVFPENLGNVSLESFYKAANRVQPSFIRTDADELTYHFHIMIRYELEKQLIEGSLQVKDLREAWNSAYKTYLNIDVNDDVTGVLQDVHWSHGGFGYFPTYSLGSFYAAQFENALRQQLPDFNQQVRNGNFGNILHWLRTNIHQHGRFYSSKELCERATGEALNFDYFMQYAEKKYKGIYGLK